MPKLRPGALAYPETSYTAAALPALSRPEERRRLSAAALKALFMSGYSSDSIGPETQFIQRLKARLLQKPCPWRELVRAVRDSLDTETLQK